MKNTKHLLALTALLTSLASPSLFAEELVAVISNIKDVKGSLYISLYDKEANFLSNENPVARKKVSVDATTMNVSLGDLPPGEYALKAYHDENDNGKIDFSSTGAPSEAFGSSSASKELAPATYKEAKFDFSKSQKVNINLLR